MVYSNKFVLAVLVNGHPVKELANGVVKVPFGCDYTLRLRNKNSRRALVTISIDGENVSGGGYIVPANDFVDIERWADKPVKFKFVSLESEEAVDFGKNGPNEDKVKGTIEARFFLEKESPVIPVEHHHHHHYPKPIYPYTIPPYSSPPIWYSNAPTVTYRSGDDSSGYLRSTSLSSQADFLGAKSFSFPVPTAATPSMDGCTVEGNYSSQSFRTVYFDAEADYVALKVFLQGYNERMAVAQPVRHETVKSNKLRDLEEENERLKEQLRKRDQEAEAIRKAEEENKRLKESLL